MLRILSRIKDVFFCFFPSLNWDHWLERKRKVKFWRQTAGLLIIQSQKWNRNKRWNELQSLCCKMLSEFFLKRGTNTCFFFKCFVNKQIKIGIIKSNKKYFLWKEETKSNKKTKRQKCWKNFAINDLFVIHDVQFTL